MGTIQWIYKEPLGSFWSYLKHSINSIIGIIILFLTNLNKHTDFCLCVMKQYHLLFTHYIYWGTSAFSVSAYSSIGITQHVPTARQTDRLTARQTDKETEAGNVPQVIEAVHADLSWWAWPLAARGYFALTSSSVVLSLACEGCSIPEAHLSSCWRLRQHTTLSLHH